MKLICSSFFLLLLLLLLLIWRNELRPTGTRVFSENSFVDEIRRAFARGGGGSGGITYPRRRELSGRDVSRLEKERSEGTCPPPWVGGGPVQVYCQFMITQDHSKLQKPVKFFPAATSSSPKFPLAGQFSMGVQRYINTLGKTKDTKLN